MTCNCQTPTTDLMEFKLPEKYGGKTTSVHICTTCGRPCPGQAVEKSTNLSGPLGDLLKEVDSAAAAGATEGELLQIMTRRQFEAGVIYGSVLTARALAEKVTFRGRLKRIKALWPLDTNEKTQEVEDLLLMGDHHNGA